MPTFVTLQPRFPFGGLTISRCVDALIRQVLLDPPPYVRRHTCGDWGDVRAEPRSYNDAALELGGYLLSSYAISDGLALCIFTEADRNLTAVFLLDDFDPQLGAFTRIVNGEDDLALAATATHLMLRTVTP
ncbi:Plasmid related protein [Pseudomonas orientalis]|uniref:hypothetical protein n=1 Tax=Pseudomonas orientalis TaxID=76758 RepID=UPI000F6D06B2|nr:hypothetical protein [Pseudomonas orientalis]AZE94079.1 Plasmid related protein [Pseudomonas orientalis]